MREIVIQIPVLEAEQNIEIDVRINGRKRTMKYRVEIVDWEPDTQTTDAKIDVIRKVIREHDKDWRLVQIGAPLKDNIPIMFKLRGEEVTEEA